MGKYVNYRKLAFEYYKPPHVCVVCGFGIPDVLEVAHVDGNRKNNKVENLVILCPTCHRMHDVDLISRPMIKKLRSRRRKADWSKLQRGGKSMRSYKITRHKAAKAAHKTRKRRKRSAAVKRRARNRKKKSRR